MILPDIKCLTTYFYFFFVPVLVVYYSSAETNPVPKVPVTKLGTTVWAK